MTTTRLFFAGSGGQGVLLMGKLIAYAAMAENKEVTFLPSYGAEMRGGTANCTVIVSDKPISSPLAQHADIVIAMNQPSLVKFESLVEPGQYLFINASLVKDTPKRTDIKTCLVKSNELAEGLGSAKAANMVMLGAVVRETGVVSLDSIIKAMTHEFTGKKAAMMDVNIKAVNAWSPA